MPHRRRASAISQPESRPLGSITPDCGLDVVSHLPRTLSFLHIDAPEARGPARLAQGWPILYGQYLIAVGTTGLKPPIVVTCGQYLGIVDRSQNDESLGRPAEVSRLMRLIDGVSSYVPMSGLLRHTGTNFYPIISVPSVLYTYLDNVKGAKDSS